MTPSKAHEGGPVSREDARIGANIILHPRRRRLVLCGSLGAAGDTAPSRSLVLYGRRRLLPTARLRRRDRAARLSAAPVADSVKSYHYEAHYGSRAPTLARARIGELLKHRHRDGRRARRRVPQRGRLGLCRGRRGRKRSDAAPAVEGRAVEAFVGGSQREERRRLSHCGAVLRSRYRHLSPKKTQRDRPGHEGGAGAAC